MKIPVFFRSPRYWVPVVVVLAGAGTWMMSPSLRLAIRGVKSQTIAQTKVVDAHIYDDAWFDAARVGRIDILGALLDAGYPIDAANHSGYTATILAAYDEQPAALDFLLKRGANACLGDHNGNTALMGALYKGELDVARRLLKTSCPIDQTNNAGETALSFAAMFGRTAVMRELVAQGAAPGHRDAQGNTPYQVAEKQGNQEAMQALGRIAP